jgi:thymidylate synthase
MLSLSASCATELFHQACQRLLVDGLSTSPRGLATREVLNAHLCLTQPRRRLVDLPLGRVINPAFAVAEAMWILSGSDDDWIFQYNKALRRYTDGGRLQGAYGPRLRRWHGRVDQLDQVRRRLATDPESRQATIQLFDPARDWRGFRDVPCTLGYRFFIRQGRLQMHTTMRSQDLWLGFPYDIFTATLLHELLAGWLDVDLGEYHHQVDSLHVYQEDQVAAHALPAPDRQLRAMEPIGAGWDGFDHLLTTVITGDLIIGANSAGDGWQAFAQVMRSYRSWTSGNRDAARADAAAIPGLLGEALVRWYARLQAGPPRKPASRSSL